MYSIVNNKITIVQGDTATFDIVLKAEVDGALEDYTPAEGDMLTFKVKKMLNGPALITKTGTTISLSSADTKQLPPGEYVYDIEFVSADNTVIDHVVTVNKFIVKEAL